MADQVTERWVRNISDERAVAKGCRFDVERGAYTVFWIEHYLKLYEGEQAGQPLNQHGCHQCGTYDLPPATDFEDWEEARESSLIRAERYAECVAARHALDWQYECTMRIFGWVRWSKHWQREVRRFTEAIVFIAKKNKKSPELSAWGYYLLCGDGEPGQKVFLAAKDGKQARTIIGEHALQMLNRSEDLGRECKINLSSLRISHLPTTSFMEPLSSSNVRTQEAKEGLNGCVLIDEVHVVDRAFARRINRAGISRSEPIRIEVSTAGNNPDGYGKERFDYAQGVIDGTLDNQKVFAAVYAAPQDLDHEELDKDPLKFGRMANPAMGHTVDPEELLDDYHSSKVSLPALLDFLMYRCNVWQRAANPWLKSADWTRCRRIYTEAELLGQECWAGLDLSRTKAMSSLVLAFRGALPDTFFLLPYFWLPADRVQELVQVASVQEWQASGRLLVTPGGVTDYGFIKDHFRELHQKFRIRELAYDPHFAEEVTQAIEQGVVGKEGQVIEAGTGVPRFRFDQNDQNFAAPTHDFERFVIAGTLHHNDHPILTWQAGHAHVIKRASKVFRVVAPSRRSDEPRTVDGVIAAIMALARATLANQCPPPGRYYEDHEVESF